MKKDSTITLAKQRKYLLCDDTDYAMLNKWRKYCKSKKLPVIAVRQLTLNDVVVELDTRSNGFVLDDEGMRKVRKLVERLPTLGWKKKHLFLSPFSCRIPTPISEAENMAYQLFRIGTNHTEPKEVRKK